MAAGILPAAIQSVKKLVFDRLAEGKETPKTNKSNSSAYDGTLEFDLCSKSKHLAQQDLYPLSVKKQKFLPSFPLVEGFCESHDIILCFDDLGVLCRSAWQPAFYRLPCIYMLSATKRRFCRSRRTQIHFFNNNRLFTQENTCTTQIPML